MENNGFAEEVNIKIEAEEYDDSVYHPVEEENYENVPQLETSSSNIHVSRMSGPVEEFEVKNEPIGFNEKQMWSPIREITSSGVEIVRIPADENEIEIKDEPFDMEDVKGDTESFPINEDEFQCYLCMRQYKHRYNLFHHLKTKHKKKPFECYICREKFIHKKYLKKHLKKFHLCLKCKTCGKSFNYKCNLIEHTKRFKGNCNGFTCPECHKKFPSQNALATHKFKQHKIKAFQCDICNRSFSTKRNLSDHNKSGRCRIQTFLCPNCNARYTYKRSLVRHMKKKHAGDRDDCLDEPKAKVARIVTPNANVVVKEEGISMGNAPIDTEILPTEARNTSG